MSYRVFYFFKRSGESVSSANAVEMSTHDIRAKLLGHLCGMDDYLGILDVEGNVLQILYEPSRERFWVELPMDAAKASYGCHMDMAGLEDLIQTLPRIFDPDSIQGLDYRPW